MVAANFGIVDVASGWEMFGGSTIGHIVIDVLMLLPSLLQVPIIYIVVRTNNMLTAIAELDVDVVSMVIEETEEMAVLEEEVVTVIRNRFEEMGAKKDFLAKLFKSMDTDGGGSLDIKEVKVAMMKMGVHLSQTKMKRFFRLMDQNKTGEISYPDFHKLIFPEDDIVEKAKANQLAMKAHASKKKQYIQKEDKLYDDTFEGEFKSYLKAVDENEQEKAAQQRKLGAQKALQEERTRIMRIKTGQLNQLAADNRASKLVGKQRSMQQDLLGQTDFDL
jgi:hypothetical protein